MELIRNINGLITSYSGKKMRFLRELRFCFQNSLFKNKKRKLTQALRQAIIFMLHLHFKDFTTKDLSIGYNRGFFLFVLIFQS